MGASILFSFILLIHCYAVVQSLESEAARIEGISFIDATTDSIIPSDLTPNYEIDYDKIGTKSINVLLIPNNTTQSVMVRLDNPSISFCERSRPFALFRNWAGNDGESDRFIGRNIPAGIRTIKATPFSGLRCKGRTAGVDFEMTFRVLDGHPHVIESTNTPHASPTNSPTSQATSTPSKSPVVSPTMSPSSEPSSGPVDAPTQSPVASPTGKPTEFPTENPTQSPTSGRFQPRVVTVESYPARKVAGVVDLPEGSPWCNGKPTYWLPGHKYEDDAPNCYINGKWIRPSTAMLDIRDTLNDGDGPEVIDRHDCAALDIDNDGTLDLYCLVGANKGTGEGYNEVYLTQPDGSLQKVLRNGLQKHKGLRGRHTVVLEGPGDEQFVFMATKGGPRSDGKSNMHHMYRKTGLAPDYFEEVEGPFNKYTDATCTYKTDVNGDGLDDLILCNHKDYGMLFVQKNDGSWDEIPWNENNRQKNWRKVRVADFNGDGIQDLLIVYWQDAAKLRLFPGIKEAPYFDFNNRYFEADFPYGSPDIEVLDVNDDGILDFYVVQSDETVKDPEGLLHQEVYCAGKFVHKMWWPSGNQPPKEFVPPKDLARDVLYIGKGPDQPIHARFEPIIMSHSEPGCGNLVRPFGKKKLFLAQGDFVRPGHNLVLEWD